jgi:ABC-type glycerol-3-phosphate transport system substrate-binding protein
MTYKTKVMPKPSEAEGLGDLFQTGRVAQFHAGSWNLPDYNKTAKFDWDLHHLPSKKVEVSISDVGGAGFSMAKNTQYPEAAWELLKMLNNALAEINAETGGEFPTDPGLFARWQEAPGPPYARKEFLEWNVTYGAPRAITPGFLQWRREWQDEIILALNDEKSVAEAMKEGARKVNAVLDEQW